MAASNRLLTYTDAGVIAGVSRTTIARWVDEGHLLAVCMPSSTRRRIRERSLLSFLDSLPHETQVPSKFASSEE